MPVLDFGSQETRSPRRFRTAKILALCGIVAALVLGTTFAANINLTASGNDRIQFGQGVTRTVVCGDSKVDVLLTPNSSFVNAPRSEGGGDFFFTGLTLSNIPSDCLGTSFKFRAYSSNSDTPLQLSTCATDGKSISVYFNGEDEASPTGVTDLSFDDFGNSASTNAMTSTSFSLNWNGDCDGAPISATSVYRVTIESQQGLAPQVKSYNGHYYQYVEESLSWNEAYDAVEIRNPDNSCKFVYRGLCGYLATITSSGENNFITTKVGTNSAWVGAADHGGRTNDLTLCGGWSEGVWRWVSGPEKCDRFSSPNNPGSEHNVLVDGSYSNWNYGEPNNSGSNEHVLQLLSGGSGEWNDLPQYWSGWVSGYVVEYSSNYTP